MLAYVLALVVGLGSFALYMAAFFFPEVHRKQDFIWSGVGLFYALVLWVCAGRITGGVLLGQLASIALLGWFGWQTLTLRRELLPSEQQTPIPAQGELTEKLKNLSSTGRIPGLPERAASFFQNRFGKSTPATQASSPNVTVIDATSTLAEPTIEDIEEVEDAIASSIVDTPPELVRPNPPDPELVEAAQKSEHSDVPESSETIAVSIEEIAAEVELAPPAEPPGEGDPAMRQTIDSENPPTQS